MPPMSSHVSFRLCRDNASSRQRAASEETEQPAPAREARSLPHSVGRPRFHGIRCSIFASSCAKVAAAHVRSGILNTSAWRCWMRRCRTLSATKLRESCEAFYRRKVRRVYAWDRFAGFPPPRVPCPEAIEGTAIVEACRAGEDVKSGLAPRPCRSFAQLRFFYC